MHFSLLQNAFLLTAECISPYCIWSLKDSAHHIPNQTEIATEEFCPKSLLRKQNEIDFIESHFQKRLYHKCTPMVSVLLFSFGGHMLAWGTKTSFGAYFPFTFGGEDSKQNKKVFITNAPQWFWYCCFLLGQNSRSLGGPHFSLGGHGPEMTPVAPGLHGCLCKKLTALVL